MFGFLHEENNGHLLYSIRGSQLYQLHDNAGNTPASTEFHSKRTGDAARVDEL